MLGKKAAEQAADAYKWSTVRRIEGVKGYEV